MAALSFSSRAVAAAAEPRKESQLRGEKAEWGRGGWGVVGEGDRDKWMILGPGVPGTS